MGRMSMIEDAAVFDAVGQQLTRHGSVKLQDIVSRTGISVGSLYHRYGSREILLARSWIDAVSKFQNRFLTELESGLNDAGERAAMTTPQFCREYPERARILVCCRREEFLSNDIPEELQKSISEINARAVGSVTRFARKNDLSLQSCQLGMVAYPLGAVRLYLPNKKVPPSIDKHVAAAYRAATMLGAS